MKVIEVVVRGVIFERGKVLLCHRMGKSNTFLPGGHIEFGEPARPALKRELSEELEMGVGIVEFLGAVEHSWGDENGLNHVVELIFKVESDWIGESPSSRESYLEFLWQPVQDLKSAELEPSVLIELLPKWLSSKLDTGWGTTIERRIKS